MRTVHGGQTYEFLPNGKFVRTPPPGPLNRAVEGDYRVEPGNLLIFTEVQRGTTGREFSVIGNVLTMISGDGSTSKYRRIGKWRQRD
jgi:hypothetical protein